MKGRYFLLPMLDGWTDVFQVPGKRTSGTKAQTFAITGPGWSGELPKGVTEYKSPTSLVWLLGHLPSASLWTGLGLLAALGTAVVLLLGMQPEVAGCRHGGAT